MTGKGQGKILNFFSCFHFLATKLSIFGPLDSGVGLRYGPPNLFNYFMNEAKYAEEVGLRVCGQAEERKEKEKNMPRRILHRAKKIYSFTCNLPNFNTQQDGANN